MSFNCKQISPLVSMYTNTSLVPRPSLFTLFFWEINKCFHPGYFGIQGYSLSVPKMPYVIPLHL